MKIQNNVFGPKGGLFIYFYPKIIACLNYGWNKTQTVLFWNVALNLYNSFYISALNRHHPYRQVHVALWWSHWLPSNPRLATLAPSSTSPAVILAKNTEKKVMKRWSKRGCLGLITKPDGYRCATNHLTYAKYKENQIIMGWKTSLWHICAGI